MNEAKQPSSSASGIAWDLSDLYRGLDDPAIERDLAEAMKRGEAFAAAYRGKIAALRPEDVDLVLTAVREFESLAEQMDKPSVYAMLVHSAQTDDPRDAPAGPHQGAAHRHQQAPDLLRSGMDPAQRRRGPEVGHASGS